MKRLTLFFATVLSAAAVWADNGSTTVEQVTSPTTLSEDVDLHITSATPFTAEGSIDITNKEHAVIIFDNLKPSLAAKQLKYITIDGKAAKDGNNCQFRIYDRGAILLPYTREGTTAANFHPLTVFSEQNLQGDSCNLFGLEHSGGFMNTLTTAKLSKRIRSFRLKRGYMVTFSIKSGGYGYSRCFIADKADLVFKTLPAILDKRIVSYRVFRWQNTSKVGVADMGASDLAKLNAQTSFTWSAGSNMLPDIEYVPHHIDESWPAPADCGKVTWSPHMKTNNEPRNESDHGTWTMEQILGNWEKLMATGMRLCTPSSWDGSDYWNATGFLADFLREIDKRGWRCDIIDLHGYWNEGSFSQNVNNWAQTFKRPVWISEWVWGSSWGPAGIFSYVPNSRWDNPNADDLAKNKEVLTRILNNLNSNNACERYFYWNGERNCSKILLNGNLTPAGEYFATMQTNGPGYTGYGNYVPKAPTMEAPSGLTVTFTKRTGTVALKWNNNNGGLTDLAIIQHKKDGIWVNVDTVLTESDTPSANLKMNEAELRGLQTFRIADVDYDGKTRLSNEATFFNGEATAIADIMAGNIIAGNTDALSISFSDLERIPAVICGLISNRNTTNAVLNHLRSVTKNSFSYQLDPWLLGKDVTIKNAENVDYIVAQPGQYTWGTMRAEVDTCFFQNSKGQMAYRSSGDTCRVNFRQPFAEGVTPIVIVQNVSSQANLPTVTKVFDVTPEGFSFKIMAQVANSTTIREQLCYYIAITPGSAPLADSGYLIHAGLSTEPTGGTASVDHYFIDQKGDTLKLIEPIVIAGGQTHFLDVPSVFRKASDITVKITNDAGEQETRITGMYVRRQVDPTATIPSGMNTASKTGDHIGWIVIDRDPAVNAINDMDGDPASGFQYGAAATRIFTTDGRLVPAGSVLRPGLYIFTDGRSSRKIMVK